MAKNKHLTDDERLKIEQWLRDRVSIRQMASKLNKATSTVSREIRSRTVTSNKYAPYRIQNRCVKRGSCQKRYLCIDKPNCTKRCSTCGLCNELCEDYQEELCYRLFEPPYVCNGCIEEYQCVLQKKYYLHRQAHEAYRKTLMESRIGANITRDELLALDEIVSPLIIRGQSVHHIVTHNPDEFDVSEKSIYRYIAGGLLKAKNMDMPRVCRIKPRKSKPVEHKVDSGCQIGRTYAEF